MGTGGHREEDAWERVGLTERQTLVNWKIPILMQYSIKSRKKQSLQ